MEGYRFVVEERVVWRDMDALGHVNSAVYLTYFETSRIEYLNFVMESPNATKEVIVAEATISYKSPAFLGDVLLIGTRLSEMRNKSCIILGEIRAKNDERLVATARVVALCYDYAQGQSIPFPLQWRERFSAYEEHSFQVETGGHSPAGKER